MKLSVDLPPLRAGAPLALLAGLLALPAAAAARGDDLDLPPAVSACEAAANPRWHLPTGRHLAAMPREQRPAKGALHVDRVHGSCILRVTDHAQEPPRGSARIDSARRQSFNADESRLLVLAQDGHWHLYDARTLRHRAVLPAIGADAEPQWHPTRADLLYYLPRRGAGMQLLELDVQTGRTRVAADFATAVRQRWPAAHVVWTRGEGAPSADGRYWAFLVDDAAQGGLGLVTWDLQEHRLIASLDLGALQKGRPERIGMSLSGRHVVVSWADGPTVFTRELSQPRRLQGRSAPFDLALTAEGDDAYVSVDTEGAGLPLFMTNLRTGERIPLFPTQHANGATALQVSGRAHRRPGWVLVSTHSEPGKGMRQWLHRRLMAVELKASPRIVHLAFHRSHTARPGSEPQASVNRDFTRVLFNSNWGSTEPDVDTYMVLLPREALPR